LIGNIDTAFYHQFFDIPNAHIESKVQPNGAADNVRVETVPGVD
jgi:hypothetical protein